MNMHPNFSLAAAAGNGVARDVAELCQQKLASHCAFITEPAASETSSELLEVRTLTAAVPVSSAHGKPLTAVLRHRSSHCKSSSSYCTTSTVRNQVRRVTQLMPRASSFAWRLSLLAELTFTHAIRALLDVQTRASRRLSALSILRGCA